jgi:SAM-dependent methyltransferase
VRGFLAKIGKLEMRVFNMSDRSYYVSPAESTLLPFGQSLGNARMTEAASTRRRDFTPAVPLLWTYDPIVAAFTREDRWRSALLHQLHPVEGDVIADVGCGTASFLALLGKSASPAKLIGIDPDDKILAKARAKLGAAGVAVDLQRGYLRAVDTLLSGTSVTKIVSSLVFHQVPLAEKRAGLRAMHRALPPRGQLHIADYGLQRTWLMRSLFRIVQIVDGFEDTQPNADGLLPGLMAEAGFIDISETMVIPTATGSISIYRAIKAATGETRA